MLKIMASTADYLPQSISKKAGHDSTLPAATLQDLEASLGLGMPACGKNYLFR